MEDADEDLNNEKKKSLKQEVDSLKLVVEMKTEEMKILRGEYNKVMYELENSDMLRDELKKATARLEDLEEQLQLRRKIER